jgi:hypothetical protein
MPGMKAFFDFNIGDQFEYYVRGTYVSCWCHGDGRRKYQITSKQVNGNNLTYEISGFEKLELYDNSPTPWPSTTVVTELNTTLTFIDSASHIGNMFNGQMVNLTRNGIRDFMGGRTLMYAG